MKSYLTVFFDSKDMFDSFVNIAGEENINIIAGNFMKIRGGAEITAILGKDEDELESENILVVCGEKMKKLPNIYASGSVSVIFSSSSKAVLSPKQLSNYKFITCGFSLKDTVTLSSVTSDIKVVSIQRAFYCMNGDKIEPMELVINSSENCGENMLMVVTALLFSGIWKKRMD